MEIGLALLTVVPIIAKLWWDLRKSRKDIDNLTEDYEHVWKGIVARGFLEATKLGYMSMSNSIWTVDHRALGIYSKIALDLKQIRHDLLKKTGHEPSDYTLAFAIERKHQEWLMLNACPELGVDRHGCLAIACTIARQTEGVI